MRKCFCLCLLLGVTGAIFVSALAAVPAPARAAVTTPNLAQGRPVTASSVESASYAASNAVDGSMSTRWSTAFSDPQWLYVDLGARYNINEVVLNWEVAYGKAYQIQVSNDASTWTTIYSTTTGAGGVNDLTGLSGTGRYVRMYGTIRGTQWGYSLWEFSVYGTPVPPSPTLAAPVLTVSGNTLSWKALSGVTSYKLATISNPTTTRNTTYQIVTGTSFTPTPVPGQTVNYGLEANLANAPWAAEVTINWPNLPPTPPVVPAAPVLTVSGSTLSWKALSGVTSYNLATITNPTTTRNTTYQIVSGTSFTPTAVPGQTVNYGLEANVANAPWAAEVTINWPAKAPVVPPPPPAALAPVGIPGSWTKLIFDDEFSGSSLNTNLWTPNWFGATNTSITDAAFDGAVNCNDPSQVTEGSGELDLTSVARSCDGEPYASGMVSTSAHFHFTYGAMEARIWMPGSGAIPANSPAWWAVTDDGVTGEIDAEEGLDGSLCWHYHSPAGAPGGCSAVPGAATGWHTYSADWEPGVITYYYDGVQVGRVTSNVTSEPMYLILYLELSSALNPPITPSSTMRVDYVRVWQH